MCMAWENIVYMYIKFWLKKKLLIICGFRSQVTVILQFKF